MLTKINRETCFSQYPNFPWCRYDPVEEKENFFYPKVYKSYVLTLPAKSFRGQVAALAKEIAKLIKALQADSLIFVGDSETPWLVQPRSYPPVEKAQAYLVSQKVGKRFNGALNMALPDLPEFIKHLAWLTRCNAALPYIYFTDKSQTIVGNVCPYGNLHLDTLDEQTDKTLQSFLKVSRFETGNERDCVNQFSKTNAIPGRQILV